MRRARDESGARLFRIEKFLMPQQMAAFFSRLAVQSRQQVDEGEIHEEDISATVEESNFDDVRTNRSAMRTWGLMLKFIPFGWNAVLTYQCLEAELLQAKR